MIRFYQGSCAAEPSPALEIESALAISLIHQTPYLIRRQKDESGIKGYGECASIERKREREREREKERKKETGKRGERGLSEKENKMEERFREETMRDGARG